jgi:CHAT domain-containing protein
LSSSEKIKEAIRESNDIELIDLYNEYVSSKNSLAKAYSLTGEAESNLKINVDSLEEISNSHERELAKRIRIFANHLNKRKYTWEDIRDKLKPDETAVTLIRYPYYMKVRTDTIQYAALIITRETISYPRLIVLENRPELEEKYMAQYYASNLSGNDSITEQSCYQVFWEEIEKEIEDKDVVYFCPDGVYHMINLNTLQYPDGEYLYAKKDIVILNSLMEMLEEEERSDNSMSALLIGSPEYSLDKESQQQLAANFANEVSSAGSYPLTRDYRNYSLQKLPGTKIEIEEINDLLKSHNWSTQCYIGKQALEEVIKSVENPQVLHLATHGFFTKNIHDDRNEQDNLYLFGKSSMRAINNPLLRSGLMFCGSQNTLDGKHDPLAQLDDGILTGYEAMDLNLSNTELVILSACETGLGEIKDGEGVYGLQRAFKIAGAKNIIMSLWKVDDNATQLLMRKFYEFWMAGNPKREAFKMAQDHLRTQTVYKEPYYWGGFVYIGMDPPDSAFKTIQLLWLIVLVFPMGLLIYYRKRVLSKNNSPGS